MPKKLDDAIGAEIVASNPKYAGRKAAYLSRLRYDLRRKEKGLCLKPACPNQTIHNYCDTHRALRNERQNRAYLRRKKEQSVNKTKQS